MAVERFDFPPIQLLPTVKSHEIFSTVDPAVVSEMLDWFRENDRDVTAMHKSEFFTIYVPT